MREILIALAALGGMGLLLGLALTAAARIFAVPADARLEKLIDALPGANCGGCGCSGCADYAAAVLAGREPPGKCSVGGEAVAKKMAELLGVEAEPAQRTVAFVRCAGGSHTKGTYEGISDCVAAAKVAGCGPQVCSFGCLGYGSCVAACQFGAIHMVNGAAKVDAEACVGCMQCAAACPKKLIVPVPYGQHAAIPCASVCSGAVTVKSCVTGCIGCGKCKKVCPADAILLEKGLARIDPARCTGCGACAAACPRKLIVPPKWADA